MDQEELERVLDEADVAVYETPRGIKLSAKPPGDVVTFESKEMLENYRSVMGYEDAVVAVYEAVGNEDEVAEVLADADDPMLPQVVGAVDDDNIPLSAEECRELCDRGKS